VNSFSVFISSDERRYPTRSDVGKGWLDPFSHCSSADIRQENGNYGNVFNPEEIRRYIRDGRIDDRRIRNNTRRIRWKRTTTFLQSLSIRRAVQCYRYMIIINVFH